METINFLKFLINSNIVLVISLIIILIYFTNTKLLKKRGFGDEFIMFKKKDYKKRIIGMIIAIPLLELLAGFITYLIFGELSNTTHLLIAFIIFLVLIIPFPILDSLKTAKKQQDVMVKTKSSIVVDFKYKIFHSVFNPSMEIVATLFVSAYFIAFVKYVSPLILLHLALIWLMYLLILKSKRLNKPLMRESYYYTFVIILLNHLLVIFLIVYPFFTTLECCANAAMFMSGFNLAVLLILKVGYYLFNTPSMINELQ